MFGVDLFNVELLFSTTENQMYCVQFTLEQGSTMDSYLIYDAYICKWK